ncbi:hypothetical protein OAO72_06135 [Alphaproteobacteria bacterium]|nr:hypothetical protein [Alphaproteobacteria bacterium]
MPRRRRAQADSNLFSIDFDYIETVLQEANAQIVSKAENILDEGSVFQGPITSNNEAEKLKTLVTNIRSQMREVSRARLSDGRPFSEAAKVIKEWFGKTEDRLKALDNRLSDILSDYTARLASEAEAVRQRNAERERISIEGTQAPEALPRRPVGITLQGDPVVSVAMPTSQPSFEEDFEEEPEPEMPDVNLEWRVKNYSVDKLDITLLMPYLSDFAIKTALSNHLKENGPNLLEGVEYEQVVAKNL